MKPAREQRVKMLATLGIPPEAIRVLLDAKPNQTSSRHIEDFREYALNMLVAHDPGIVEHWTERVANVPEQEAINDIKQQLKKLAEGILQTEQYGIVENPEEYAFYVQFLEEPTLTDAAHAALLQLKQ